MRTLRFPEADPYSARVLESFVEADGSLRGIPVQRKKRLVVLRWLVEDFQPGRRYPEAEVNRIIGGGTRTSRISAGSWSTRS